MFFDGAIQVLQFTPEDLIRLVGRCPDATNGYCSNPTPGFRSEVRNETFVFVNLLRSWLRPHQGISQGKPPFYLGFFQLVHNARRRGEALLALPSRAWSHDPPPPPRNPTRATQNFLAFHNLTAEW